MKVLFIYFIPSGGVETLNRERCHVLNKNGITCHLLYLSSGEGIQNIKDIPTFITDKSKEIKQILDRENYQAVVVCSHYKFLQVIRQLGFKGALIYELQGVGENVKEYFQGSERFVKKYADAILIPVTPHLIEYVKHFFPDKKTYCFHNCFDINRFHFESGSAQQGNTPIIGWVGRIEKNKNWGSFLQIASGIKKQIPLLKIWMLEDRTLSQQSERHLFNKTVSELGLKGDLTLNSNIPHKEMPNYYSTIGQSGGFLCSTSVKEGFGYAAVEAMSCQCPVLTSDSDGVKAFITHNQTGKFFDLNNNSQAIKEGLELINQKNLRAVIIENGWNRINDICNPVAYFNNFNKMLTEVIKAEGGV